MNGRGVAIAFAVSLLVSALPALGSTRTYGDDFSSGGFGGSSGSHTWESMWVEKGESDGPSSGAVVVRTADVCEAGMCLVVEPLVDTGTFGAQRRISMAGVASASVSWHVDFGGIVVLGSALVEASADGGSWEELAYHSPSAHGRFSAPLPAATEYVDIRVRSSGLSLGSSLGFDSFVIETEMVEPTTTTTTTTNTSTTTSTTVPRDPTTTTTTGGLLTTTTTAGATTTTNNVRDRASTTTTTHRAWPTSTTTTTIENGTRATPPDSRADDETDPSRDDTTTTSVVQGTEGLPEDTGPTDPGPAPSGVVTQLAAGVSDTQPIDLTAQDRLLVRFLRITEDLRFDILLNVALGIVLAWASVTMIPRR